MTVYYITLALVVLLGYWAQSSDVPEPHIESGKAIQHAKQTGHIYFLLACVLIFVAGFRYYVGADFGAYYKGYHAYIQGIPHAIRSLDEPGYGILAWIATRFYDDGAAAIFLASFVTIALPMAIIYRHSDRLLMVSFLYFACCWDGSFNGVRQYLAASVLFCGFSALQNRNLVQYLMVTFIAFLFHRSAIVMSVLYFVVHRKVSVVNILILILTAAIMLFSYDQLLSFAGEVMEKNYSMENAYTATQVNRLRVIAACLPALVFMFMYYNKELTDSETFYLNLTILHAAVRVFTMNSALLYRIGIYTTAFQVIAIPELLKGVEGRNRRLISAGLMAMYLGLWWYEIYKSGSINQFHWVWERF